MHEGEDAGGMLSVEGMRVATPGSAACAGAGWGMAAMVSCTHESWQCTVRPQQPTNQPAKPYCSTFDVANIFRAVRSCKGSKQITTQALLLGPHLRFGLLKLVRNTSQLLRPSCMMTSSCTRGVAVAVSAMIGTWGGKAVCVCVEGGGQVTVLC